MPRYDPARIEPKWQRYWEKQQTFQVLEDSNLPKFYVLDMFPYPSGEGLHVGHPEGYTATDIFCRYHRMRGKNVLHPMGWDAFGLPAEDYARRTGAHPRDTTYRNIDTFRKQLKSLGFSYDWKRELATTDPDYFRWTQWIFLILFDTWYDQNFVWSDGQGNTVYGKGRPISDLPIPETIREQGKESVRRYQNKNRLAYQSEAAVNWCPKLGTVLANEEVIGGLSERGSHPVERIPLRQWMLRITDYAERLLDGMNTLDWPDPIKALQRNWIGRSEGAEVDFYIQPTDPLVNDPEKLSNQIRSVHDWEKQRQSKGFPEETEPEVIRVYTTRPDTLFGATYMVLAPEHPLVDTITTVSNQPAVENYRRQAATKSDLDRTDLAKEKTGVFTGAYAINPATKKPIPIWIADYVLASYGTGAIMAVPAHDCRDWEFAHQLALPVIHVVEPPEGYVPSEEEQQLACREKGQLLYPFTSPGTAIASGKYTGQTTSEMKERITSDLKEQGLASAATNYRLRDWLFSRQHFWGEPFPILHELDQEGHPTGLLRTISPEHLPVKLPDMDNFKPHGRPDPPLDSAPDSWLFTTTENTEIAPLQESEEGASAVALKRETNTMPQWAGSCWYYLRFLDPHNSDQFVDPEKEKDWLPVNLYVGGAEHAVLHLLYSRFWHQVLYDRGYVSCPEPFQRLVNQGIILGEVELTGYQRKNGSWISAEEVSEQTDKNTGMEVLSIKLDFEDAQKTAAGFVLKNDPEIRLDSRAYKMSKSRGNVVNPDTIVERYGADSLRLYEMFMGPLEDVKPWNTKGVEGISRFLSRVWRMVSDEKSDTLSLNPAIQEVRANSEQLRLLHRTIKSVTEDVESMSFNTAISRMMEFVNSFQHEDPRPREVIEPFILLLSPFAPHLAEELWELLGHPETLAFEPWPTYEKIWTVDQTLEVPVQVNGKVRTRITIDAQSTNDQLEEQALADPKVIAVLQEKELVKVIVVPGKLVNLVVR